MQFTNNSNLFTNNSILSRHYLQYLKTINLNGELFSQNLSDTEIKILSDPKYKLTEFDAYRYILALDYIKESLGCNKYQLTEGITKDKFKYNNILIDLFYHNISRKIIYNYKNNIFTHKELVDYFHLSIINHPEPFTLKSISDLLESGDIQKVKYQCIKILEPCDINYFPIAHLKIFLIDVNKINNLLESYDSLI